MALDEAEGVISLAEQHLANSLASSSRFQEWTDSDNSTEAAAHVYFTSLPEPEDGDKYTAEELAALFPCALIYTDEQANGSVIRKVGYQTAQGSGVVAFRLYETIDDESPPTFSEAERSFKNTVGVVMAEILALSETADCLAAVEVANSEIYRTEKDAVVFLDMQTAVCIVLWGTPA